MVDLVYGEPLNLSILGMVLYWRWIYLMDVYKMYSLQVWIAQIAKLLYRPEILLMRKWLGGSTK